jgi:hypothetical protein
VSQFARISLITALVTSLACKNNEKIGVQASASSVSVCERLRACCHEVSRKAQVEEAPCVAWTHPDPENAGECGSGTDCWCGAMLEKFQAEFGVCK